MFYESNEFVDPVPDHEFKYFIEGDTLIAGQNCKKFYSFNENNNNKTEYKMALHESEGKVYFIPDGSTKSFILYDFTIPVGISTVISSVSSPESNIEMRNNRNGITKTNGISRHCLLVNWVANTLTPGWWIEGIGSELGPLDNFQFGSTGAYILFLNCEVNEETVFNMTDFRKDIEKGEYYPEGTRWTEIRLDTLKYDSWYSKVGEEWVPNFETIEYRVQGEYADMGEVYKKVYSNGPEWTDSLAFLLLESGQNVEMTVIAGDNVLWPGETYQFDWRVGKGLYYRDILESNTTHEYPYYFFFGEIKEIKEGDFGGVRPLKYVDLDGKAPDNTYEDWDWGYTDARGGRIIQGIGITEWNDGECLFGPPNPYYASYGWRSDYKDRHYRSMLVHFERDGEVLYDVWPEKVAVTEEPVTFTEGQMATIVLPTVPDASKGKYYRLDRCEEGQIIFEQELQPQAHIPYIIVPSEDFSIDTSTLDLAGLSNDTVSIGGISFIGSYSSETLNEPEGFYIDIIDTTPDCGFSTTEETGKKAYIGALRAYLQVSWDEPYNHGGSKGPGKKLEIVLKDYGTSIGEIHNSQFIIHNEEGAIYDLQGRRIYGKPARGVYIEKGKLKVKN